VADDGVQRIARQPVAVTAMNDFAIKPGNGRRKLPQRDFHRAFAVVCCLALIVAVALFYNPSLVPGFRSNPSSYTFKGDPADNPLRTGSLTIVPEAGKRCQHRLIDNQTWTIRDNGSADCEELMNRNAAQNGGGDFPARRLDAIRDGFRKNAPR
jgi:hypothetical protein